MNNINTINDLYSEFSDYFGSLSILARKLNISKMAVSQWKTRKSIKLKYAFQIQKISNNHFDAVHIIKIFNEDVMSKFLKDNGKIPTSAGKTPASNKT